MDLHTAATLSFLLLAIEGFIIVLPLGVMLFYMLRGVRAGRSWLRTTGLPQGQRYAATAAKETRRYSDKVTNPFVQVEEVTAAGRATLSSLPAALRQRRKK